MNAIEYKSFLLFILQAEDITLLCQDVWWIIKSIRLQNNKIKLIFTRLYKIKMLVSSVFHCFF